MIRFGILGAGNIAHRFAASLAKVEGAELVAASRRTAEKAAAFLAEVPCASGARAYGDHEALLADPEVDAIYLALPHDLHHAWALRALDAGKAVLCEKPAMLSEAEAAEVTAAARERGLLFMEAMKTRFVPLHPHVMDAVGALGPVARVHASLCNDALASYRTRDTYILGGGPGSGVLLDCGIYCASWLDELLPGEIAVERVDTAFYGGSDVYVDAHMAIGGVAAELECARGRGSWSSRASGACSRSTTCTVLNMRSFESRASKLVFSTCPTRLTISMAKSPISAASCARARLKAP